MSREGFALDTATAARELGEALEAFKTALDRLTPQGADERELGDTAEKASVELGDAVAKLRVAAKRAAP